MKKFLLSTRLRIMELARQPLTLLILVLLPPAVIETYGIAVASFPQLPSLGAEPATIGRITGTLFSVAFLAGLIGLFQVISARKGDERVAITGFPKRVTLAARVLTMVIVSILGAAVAFLVFNFRVAISSPLLAFWALTLAGLVYGLLGVIIGSFIPEPLEGSIVLVFMADLDNALSSGLFPISASISVPLIGKVGVTDLVPLYHPHELFVAAILRGELVTKHLFPVIGWITGLVLIAFLGYGHSTGDRGFATVRGWF